VSRFKSLFSYYGGKSKIAHLYPPPECDRIVEPFAGGAGYSLLYPERQVTLVEKNPATAAMWRYLIETPLETVLRDVPADVQRGTRVSSLLAPGSPGGLAALLASAASVGEAGSYCYADRTVTAFGEKSWPRLRERIAHFHPKIRHWTLIEGDYTEAPDVEATWYVDPPYQGRLGARYFCNQIDYKALAQWCQARKGQVVVCENEGATWMDFEPVKTVRNLKNRSVEVAWCKSSTGAVGVAPAKAK
jgi:site-specific DNA-adenine methylase